MAVDVATKKLFGIRFHPEREPHVILALLATSAKEAEKIARQKTGYSSEPVTTKECSADDVVMVTFK